MKNFYILILLLISNILVKAQAFQQSTISDVLIQSSVHPGHTGNDILDDGTGIYRVSVCDNPGNNAPGLVYDVDISATNYQATDPFSYRDAYDPDVCIVTGTNSVVYALVVYYSSNAGSFVFDVFEWSGTSFNLSYTDFFGSTFGTAVNIDSDNQGNFVVVFDDGTGDVLTCGGVAGTGPTISTPGRLNNSGTKTNPDICIYPDGVATVVYICYLENTSTILTTRVTNLANATGGSPYGGTYVTSRTASTNYVLETPRIACGITSGNNTDYTVVYLETDRVNGYYYIRGFTRLGASYINHIYNDISGPADLHTKENINPVVAYDSRSSYNIWIGWTFNDNGTPLGPTGAIYPLVIQCNSAGDNVAGDYWIVPNALNTTYPNNYYDLLSLASRWSDTSNEELLLTFYDDGDGIF